MNAIDAKDAVTVKKVLAKNQNLIHDFDSKIEPALYRASTIKNINPQITQALIDAGSNVNYAHEGKTMLMQAVDSENWDLFFQLLKKDADVHAIDNTDDKNTVLAYLLEMREERKDKRFYDAAKALISKVIDVNRRMERLFGLSPLVYEIKYVNRPVLEQDYGWLGRDHDIELIKILLAAKANTADLDTQGDNKQGNTPLFLASNKGRADIVQLLLDAGADPYDFGTDQQGNRIKMNPICAAIGWYVELAEEEQKEKTIQIMDVFMKKKIHQQPCGESKEDGDVLKLLNEAESEGYDVSAIKQLFEKHNVFMPQQLSSLAHDLQALYKVL